MREGHKHVQSDCMRSWRYFSYSETQRGSSALWNKYTVIRKAQLTPQKASHSLKAFIMNFEISRFLGKCMTSCPSLTVLCSALMLCRIMKNCWTVSPTPWCFAVTTVGQAAPCSGLLLTTVMVQMSPDVLSWTEEHWQLWDKHTQLASTCHAQHSQASFRTWSCPRQIRRLLKSNYTGENTTN